jgi:ubiquinone/menaquinone biosynthesis C-methylase UbiE
LVLDGAGVKIQRDSEGVSRDTHVGRRECEVPELTVATKQNIEKAFDDGAPIYDRVGPAIYEPFGTRLVDWLPLKPGATVLDIATGAGAVLLPAARLLGSKGHITGIDLSDGLLRQAEALARAEGLTNAELRKMDAEHLEFPDQSFDFVTCAFSLNFFPDMEAALDEMYRVCKPGGWLGLTMFDRTPPPFDPLFPMAIQQFAAYQGNVWIPPHGMPFAPEELEGFLKQHGWQSIETHSQKVTFIYTSEEDIWAFPPLQFTLMDADQGARAQFKEEFLARLRPLFRPDGLHVSAAVAYAKGHR